MIQVIDNDIDLKIFKTFVLVGYKVGFKCLKYRI